MYEHLLVALDGSTAAERVLEHVVALTTRFGSRVTLLRATVSPQALLAETTNPTSVGDVAPLLDPTPIVEADKENATAYLRGVARQLQARGLSEVAFEDPEGPPAEAIIRSATELDVSLLLMTTHGRGGLGRMVFGSVADRVLRHAPCPVLLVRTSDAEVAEAS